MARGPLDPRLWQASLAVRHYLTATVCCGVLIAGCAIAGAVLTARIVAGVITDPASRTLSHWAPTLLALAAVWTVRSVVAWWQARIGQRDASAAISDLSGQVLTAVTAADPRTAAEHRDDAAAVVVRGLDGLRGYFTGYLPALILAVLLTPTALIAMAYFDFQAALVVLVALPLIPIFMVLIGLATAARSAASLAAMTTLQSRMLDLVAGLPTLRALGRARGPETRIAELSTAHRRSTMSTLRIAFLSSFVLELLATLGVAIVAVSVGLRLVYGYVELLPALTVLLLAPDVFWPLRRVGVEFHAAQDGKAAADAAFRLIETAPVHRPGTRVITADRAEIRVAELTVAGRDGNRPDRLSFTAPPGAVTVLTGANGAGKSTTLAVLAGLIPATSGRVTVAGVDIAELEPAGWWRQLSWLPQRPVLVSGTVIENLQLFGPLADLDAACAAAGFDDVIGQLPQGLATRIGRGGIGLSLGQRQRLGLARSLGSAAPVLLLDEPTAHLDADTEARALQAITGRAAAGCTVVLVGHRQPVRSIADQIVEVGGHVLL